jgi:ABC-type glycerol-3-phosphate transport system substrate-binding protein
MFLPRTKKAETPLEEIYTLKIVSPSGHSVRAIYEIAGRFSQSYPHVRVEVSVIPSSTPINVFLTSKFAVGDAPDIFIYQAGSSIKLFAQGGHLLDLSTAGLSGRFYPHTEDICRYEGLLYALPLDIAVSGLFVQMHVLWQAYIRPIPQTIDEFIASCEVLRKAGFTYPIVIGAASDSGATTFLFQYLHQNIYVKNPQFYEELLQGERNWTDPEFRDMYRVYERIREYVNPDAARIDTAEAIRRFASGEAAYYLGLSRDIPNIRHIDSQLDMVLVTPPWVQERNAATALFGVDTVISVSSATRYPEEAIAFLREFTSLAGADRYVQTFGSISAMVDSYLWYDPSLGPRELIFETQKVMEFMDREWLPDFEEQFRKINRQWFIGRSPESLLEELDRVHGRMNAARGDGT